MGDLIIIIVFFAVITQWRWFARDVARFLDLVETYRREK